MLAFLGPGFGSSTQKAYTSGQRGLVEFCRQAGKFHPNGSPRLADEWKLCLFVSFLADSIQHWSVKVYLSAVRSLPLNARFSRPFA